MKYAVLEIRVLCARLDHRLKKKINLISVVMVKVVLIGCWQYLSYPRSPSLITNNLHALSLHDFQAQVIHRLVKSGRA